MTPKDSDTLFLVDGSGFIFRAYHALPPLTRSDGMPIGAVMGFTNMLVKLLKDINAEYVAVIFDAARKNFRNDIYADYKANREAPPEDLVPQFELIRSATKAFDLPCLELEGYEADDLIATYARLASEQGRRVVIVGSDKDLMQLVSDNVTLFDPIKQKDIGISDVVEKFGVTPDRVIDVQALAGDSIDNVPGVPGIGVKTAAQLIGEYGDLETLLARAEEIKQPKRRESLIEHAEAARVSKKLVTLDANVPVPMAIEDMKAHDPRSEKLVDFLKEMEFRSLLARLDADVDTPGSAAPAATPSGDDFPPCAKNVYTLINDEPTLAAWIEGAYTSGVLAVDTETTHLTPARAALCGISLSTEPGKGAYIPVGHRKPDEGRSADLFGAPEEAGSDRNDIAQLPLDTVIRALKPLLEDSSVLKVGHNMKYDMQMFMKHGVRVDPVDDTMLLSYVLDGSAHGHGMDELSELHCAHTPIAFEEVAGKGKAQITFDRVPIEKALPYAAEDAEVTFRLHRILKPGLAPAKMTSVYENIERPLVPVIADMERRGVKVDANILRSMSSDFGKKLVGLEADIHTMAGHPFNVGSPKQIGVVLFDEMGLQGGKKTKTGDWSTNAQLLEVLADQGHEIVARILEWRQLSKLKSTYTDALQEQINPETGRLHTSFSMAGTSTGRLASSDPNLQNIPIRTEEGRKIRQAFIAEEGWKILSVDYSQVELRLAAEMAGIEALKEAFRKNLDIHAITAARVFGLEPDKVTPEIRSRAKAVNFGIIYGISAWGLAKQLGIEAGDAGEFIKRYLSRFPELVTYMERCKDEARKHGYVTTLYGRKCFIAGINDKNGAIRSGAERQAINAPLQGTAADIMKMAMIAMPPALERAGLQARMLLQVHDELIFEVPEEECEETATLVRNVMENVASLSVPLTAEAGFGDSWAQAH
ncbi:MAG: DNA polymerase I [Alphaproteobacteria bacterium]|nr:DNA polymerase I [Alphaproteobacteria bacterium]